MSGSNSRILPRHKRAHTWCIRVLCISLTRYVYRPRVSYKPSLRGWFYARCHAARLADRSYLHRDRSIVVFRCDKTARCGRRIHCTRWLRFFTRVLVRTQVEFCSRIFSKKSMKFISIGSIFRFTFFFFSESHRTNHFRCRKGTFKCVYLDICLVIAAFRVT